MHLLAIDPGTTRSAYVVYGGAQIHEFGHLENEELLSAIDGWKYAASPMVVEEIESYGKPVGKEVFATVMWVGRFIQVWEPAPYVLLPRRAIKRQLCNSTTAKDPMIRQALLDRFGPGKELAIGKKATPGPLYGISGDVWQALAVAVAFVELRAEPTPEPTHAHP